MRKDERGYIVVETITCFLLLVFLIMSILSLVNIVVVQARIHYALTQAAETVSMYSYVLDVTGLDEVLGNVADSGDEVRGEASTLKNNVEQVLNGLQSLSFNSAIDGVENTAGQVKSWIDGATADPKGTVQTLLKWGIDEAVNSAAFSELMRPLVGHYLDNGSMSGDEWLKTFDVEGGLDGLEFYHFNPASATYNSHLLDANGDVWLTVNYEIDYTFGALPLPFGTLKISQTVKTKAWLGGSGKGYWK